MQFFDDAMTGLGNAARGLKDLALAPEHLAYTLTIGVVIAYAAFRLLSKPKLTARR